MTQYADFQCQKCGMTVTAIASVVVTHRCPHPITRKPYGPERTFIRLTPPPAGPIEPIQPSLWDAS